MCVCGLVSVLFCFRAEVEREEFERRRKNCGQSVSYIQCVCASTSRSPSCPQSRRERLNSFDQLKMSRAVRFSHQRMERAPLHPVSEESRLKKFTTQVDTSLSLSLSPSLPLPPPPSLPPSLSPSLPLSLSPPLPFSPGKGVCLQGESQDHCQVQSERGCH